MSAHCYRCPEIVLDKKGDERKVARYINRKKKMSPKAIGSWGYALITSL
jgi:hypothetical protein